MYDMDIVDQSNFQEVYLYIELMEADLHAIVSRSAYSACAQLLTMAPIGRYALDNLSLINISNPSFTKRYVA